ncbi:MAG: hypothetical protein JWO03_2107 [Bacteroidetes bacterium]|nr:hypothetical protein [Bacteroidota bacterium]
MASCAFGGKVKLCFTACTYILFCILSALRVKCIKPHLNTTNF